MKADPILISTTKIFLEEEERASYDSAGNVSKQELETMIKTAGEPQRQVIAWLQKDHPELLKNQLNP